LIYPHPQSYKTFLLLSERACCSSKNKFIAVELQNGFPQQHLQKNIFKKDIKNAKLGQSAWVELD
jgi:hypothetical protein